MERVKINKHCITLKFGVLVCEPVFLGHWERIQDLYRPR
jgi:hypothetical protein